MRDTISLVLVGATLVVAYMGWYTVDRVREEIRGGYERLEVVAMVATRTWRSGEDTITITTTKGVDDDGDGTVDPNESIAAWKARHLARVAAAQAPDVFPKTE